MKAASDSRDAFRAFLAGHPGYETTAALDSLKQDPNRQRGEFVLMVSGAPADAEDGEGERVLKLLLAEGLPVKQAAKLASAITGAAKNALYEQALVLKN